MRALTHVLGSSPTSPSPTAPQIHIELGRFTSAAKVQKDIGELYEAEGDTAAALKAYEEAAEYYNAEESKSQANQILLKVASLAADASNYTRAIEIYEQVWEPDCVSECLPHCMQRAIEIYEQVWRSPRKMAIDDPDGPLVRAARDRLPRVEPDCVSECLPHCMQVAIASLESNLLRFSVKGYLLSAGMCRLASGEIGAALNALERYEGMDASFSTTREGQFLRSLVSAYEAMDEEQFTEVSATDCH